MLTMQVSFLLPIRIDSNRKGRTGQGRVQYHGFVSADDIHHQQQLLQQHTSTATAVAADDRVPYCILSYVVVVLRDTYALLLFL